MSQQVTVDGEVTIELKYPILIDGTRTEVLHMRRPKVRDQILATKSEMAGKSSAEQEVLLFANLCEVAPRDIEDLDMADYRKIQREYERFLEG